MFKNENKAYADIDDKPTPTSSSQVCLLGLSFGDQLQGSSYSDTLGSTSFMFTAKSLQIPHSPHLSGLKNSFNTKSQLIN